mmetsp:Transcript_14917/g.27589  ORF Transcript_14917/g.27589 Transcript_14917/m.27589 type:complete len:354 (+) Transcript_14917:194-1255(+)
MRTPERSSSELGGGAKWEVLGAYTFCLPSTERIRELWDSHKPPVGDGSSRRMQPPTQEEPLGAVVYDTDTFRMLAKAVQPSDVCIEIGCSYGKCTEVLVAKTKKPERVLAVDIADNCVNRVKKIDPKIRVLKCNVMCAFKDLFESYKAMLKDLEETNPPLVIMCDIGGNREIESLVTLLPFLLRELKPRMILVKSEQLFEHATKLGGLNNEDWEQLRIQSYHSLLNRRPDKSALMARQKASDAAHRLNPFGVRICKYHNFDEKSGCKRFPNCEFDHEHCHACGEHGHRGFECSHEDRERDLVYTLLDMNLEGSTKQETGVTNAAHKGQTNEVTEDQVTEKDDAPIEHAHSPEP